MASENRGGSLEGPGATMTQRSNARTFDLLRLQRQGSGSFIADMQNHTCAILCGPVKQRDCRSQEAVHKGTAHGKGEADGKSKGRETKRHSKVAEQACRTLVGSDAQNHDNSKRLFALMATAASRAGCLAKASWRCTPKLPMDYQCHHPSLW